MFFTRKVVNATKKPAKRVMLAIMMTALRAMTRKVSTNASD